jgi:hypothetical protein
MIRTIISVLCRKDLRKTGFHCFFTIMRLFFWVQYKAVLFPKRIPVSQTDHPLDKTIPFNPEWVGVYLSFIPFWINTLGLIVKNFGKRSGDIARKFIKSIESLYISAYRVYRHNLSTTSRPPYYGKFRFVTIHALDPHLMCIPSLHVMVAIRTYTKFREIIKLEGKESFFKAEEEALSRGALAITQAVLYVKQHSVNCVSAAMYTMSRLCPRLFPPAEAEAFAGGLFPPGGAGQPRKAGAAGPAPTRENAVLVRQHIFTMYRSFLDQNSKRWTEPLLDYLQTLPKA